jgi:hypothetical protein
MASPNTLLLRARMALLQPHAVVEQPEPPRSALPGMFARTLREESRRTRRRRADTKAARPRKPGAIPTSGQGRVNAKKSLRLLDAAPHRPCDEPANDGPGCTGHAIPGTDRCRRHAAPEAWAAFLAATPATA